MEKKSKSTEINTELTGKEKRLKNLRPPWKKGDPSPNPKGHAPGQKNFSTLYREALIKLAKLNDKTPDELELEILSKGVMSARSGDYRFYKDLLDRLLGTATANIDVKTGGKPIGALLDEING